MARTTGGPRLRLQTMRASIAATGRRFRAESVGGSLRGRALVLARSGWLAVAGFAVALYVADVWVRIGQLHGPCPLRPGVCLHNQVPPPVQRAFAGLHLTVSFYGWYGLGRDVLFAAGFAAIGTLIFWRRSHDGVALFVSLTLLVFGLASFEGGLLSGLPSVSSGWWLPVATLMFLGEALFATFIGIFPDGRFVPRWARLAVVPIALLWLPNSFFPGSAFDFVTWPGWAYFTMWGLVLGTMGAAQIYRYRRVSTPAQRLQTKWVVFGFVTAGVGFFSGRLILFFLAPALTSPSAVMADLAGYTLNYASILLIPVCIGIAILRHRLYDIDVIIRRTLIYSIVTGTLAIVYVVSSIVLQAGFQALTRQGSTLAVVGSTLAIAGLFQPVRGRVQAAVDQRFYRRKYDAVRTVAAFSRALQSEVDLTRLTEQLLAVVEETMQPSQMSLWLAQPTRLGDAGATQSVEVAVADATDAAQL